jgi:hypothetical protein
MRDLFDIAASDAALPAWVRRAWPAERALLHGLGTPDWQRPALAIIGSTRPSPVARAWAFDLGRSAAARGWSVVSGLATGIDSHAHEGALAGGGHTLAIVAHGLDARLLDRRRSLLARIVSAGGAVLSIAEPGEPPSRERLLLRNKWTSAFAIGVVAVQSRGRDGTLATMRHAFLQGRLLATFHPPPEEATAQWNGNELLLSDTPPWRLDHAAAYGWQPLRRIQSADTFADLFTALEAHRDLLGSLDLGNEPERARQARLLEEPARLEIRQ